MAKWSQPTLQMDMWSHMVTLNPMVFEDIIVALDITMKSDHMVTRYLDPNMDDGLQVPLQTWVKII